MKNRPLYEKLYMAGTALALGGMGLVVSIAFAGAGVVLLAVALLVFLAGLLTELLAPHFSSSPESLGTPAARSTPTVRR